MVARVATGRQITPRLIRAIDGVEQPATSDEPLGVNENVLRRMRAALDAVSNHTRGTAYGSRIAADDLRLAGKTGTSQVRRITQEERDAGITRNEDLPWERRDHALFVGYAPADAPRFAITVVVEHGGGGSTAAAPIARDVLLQAMFDGPPPLSAYPSNIRSQIETLQERIQQRIAPGSSSIGRA
jgi:penicillin-binding protein 2